MAEPVEEFEPLFDYSRIQPMNFVCLDDDSSDDSPILTAKRRKKTSNSAVPEDGKAIQIADTEEKDEEDWLPPPPKIAVDKQRLSEDSTIKELRLKKQELQSFAQSAKDLVRDVEESVRRDLSASMHSSSESFVEHSSKPPPSERAKIVISIQDKDGVKQFRVYMDDKFERLFKMYADKFKLDSQSLVFLFDGDKISPTSTPDGLGMEDNDMIEVHTKAK